MRARGAASSTSVGKAGLQRFAECLELRCRLFAEGLGGPLRVVGADVFLKLQRAAAGLFRRWHLARIHPRWAGFLRWRRCLALGLSNGGRRWGGVPVGTDQGHSKTPTSPASRPQPASISYWILRRA